MILIFKMATGRHDHVRRYHLSDFERQWPKVPILGEITSASKNGYWTLVQVLGYM